MFAGVSVETGFRWLADGPISMVGAAWILQFPSDPTKGLVRQGHHIRAFTSADQLYKSSRQKLSSPSIGLRLELMPILAADGQKIVEFRRHGRRGIRPFLDALSHGWKSIQALVSNRLC